jgi:conjugal transfer pilus assembly protein TraD
MPADPVAAAERAPRPGRYLISGEIPRRDEVIAACALLTVAVHVLFAQLTLILAAAFYVTGRATRWRPQWLAVPAAAGAVWALAIGPARAAAGFADGPGRIAAYLGGLGQHPGRLLHPAWAYTGMGGWLPRQLPLALIAAAGEAAIAAWLGWLHTDEWKLPGYRPGLVTVCRRAYLTRFITAGGIVTRDGACLGLDAVTGRRSAVSWPEAEGGVLCAGSPGSGTTTTSFQIVHTAIRRRKPVIAIDLHGSTEVTESLGAVCAATKTPLHVMGAAGYYDPLRVGAPARRASLVLGMGGWEGAAAAYRRSCAAYLTDLFAVADAAPGDPRAAMLDEITHLLSPAALRARMDQVPWSGRQALGERVNVSAALVEADPGITAALASQLDELRASPLGRWLRPVPGPRVDLGQVIRDRAVVLFSLDRSVYERAATTLASLAVHDLLAVYAELRRIGVRGDGLLWLNGCDGQEQRAASELISRGATAGLPALLTTTALSPSSAIEALASQVNVLILHRLADPEAAGQLATFTGEKLAPGVQYPPDGSLSELGPFGLVRTPVVPGQSLGRLRDGEHVLIVKGPRRRLVTLGQTVPARLATSQEGRGR